MQWNLIAAPSLRGTRHAPRAADVLHEPYLPAFLGETMLKPPDEGTVPCEVSRPLCEILARHSANGDCWLGIWPGFGGREHYRKHVPPTMFVSTGNREWDLFRAPLSMMHMPFYEGWERQTANVIWSDEPAWWLATDIDLNTSYIGGDARLIGEVLESAALEALPAELDDDVTMRSDVLNLQACGIELAPEPRFCDSEIHCNPAKPRMQWGKSPWPDGKSARQGPSHFHAGGSAKGKDSRVKWELPVGKAWKRIMLACRYNVARFLVEEGCAMSTSLQKGDKAPDFSLADQHGNMVSLADFVGKSRAVLYFYPKAMTPGCTIQAQGLRDASAGLADRGAVAIGVSPDAPARLKKFEEKEGLNFTLLADEDHAVAEAYGVWGLKKFMGREYMGVHRVTFIIGKDGAIAHVIDKVKTKTHDADVLEALDALD